MTVLVGWSLAMLAIGNSDVAEVELAKVAFGAGNFGLGLMMAASGFGLILGSLGAGWAAERWGTARAYGGSIAVMAVDARRAAVAPNVWVAAVFVVALGLGNGIAVVANSLLVQRGTPDHLRGRAFTLAMSVTYSALFVGMLIGGVVSDAYGARWAWGVAAIVAGVAAVASYALARGIRLRSRSAEAEPLPSSRRPLADPPRSARSASNLRDRGAAAGVDARDARRGRPRRRQARAARAITLVENSDPLAYEVVARPLPGDRTRIRGRRDRAARRRQVDADRRARPPRARAGLSVGVISVDPSSPFTHGALLGDRIRLADHFLDPGVFIRSMGTRGHLGGVAESTLQAMLVLDAAGKDVIFLETVGAGQSEVEIIGIADTVLLVLMPGSGDSVQALKAGIMEIPDVIAINKIDHPAAKTMLNEVRSILALDTERDVEAADRADGGDALRERRRCGTRSSAHRAFLEDARRARGAAAAQPRGRGVRGRVGAREDPPRARRPRRSRAAAAARRGAAPRARPADRGSRDHGEGVQGLKTGTAPQLA